MPIKVRFVRSRAHKIKMRQQHPLLYSHPIYQTFFLNGTYIENSKFTDQNNRPQFEKFKEILDAEIAKQPQQ